MTTLENPIHINCYSNNYADAVVQANLRAVVGKKPFRALPLKGMALCLYRKNNHIIWVLLKEDEVVGTGRLSGNRTVNAGISLTYQGKGIYPAVLKRLARLYGPLESPPILSLGAIKAWERAGGVVDGAVFKLIPTY